MEFNNLLLEKDGPLAILTVNRPKALNALNDDTLKELSQAIDLVEADDEVKVLIVTGAGKAFVAGADIVAMLAKNAVEGKAFTALGQGAINKLEKMLKPVIAAINGFALGGGCELAMACDIRIASETAKFGQPSWSGNYSGFRRNPENARLVGTGMAKELIYSGNMIDANKALQIGLVNSVVPADQLMDEAKELALKIASNAPLAVRFANRQLRRNAGRH